MWFKPDLHSFNVKECIDLEKKSISSAALQLGNAGVPLSVQYASLPSLLLKSLSCDNPHHPHPSEAVSGHSPQYCLSSGQSLLLIICPIPNTHAHTPPLAPTSSLLSPAYLDQFSLPYLLRWLSKWQLLLFRRRWLQLEANSWSHSLLEKTPFASQDVQTELPIIRWRTRISCDIRSF